MTKQIINIGTSPDKGNGDPLRIAFDKINQNFTELYDNLGIDGTVFDPLNIDTNLIPKTNNTYDIGSPSKQWRSMYVGLNTLYINNVPISLDENGNLIVDGDPVGANPFDQSLNTNDEVGFSSVTSAYGFLAQINGTNPGQELVIQSGGTHNWIFHGNGQLEFPDSSQQSTAYRFSAQATAPVKTAGALWFNTTDGRLYVNYNNTWVDASPTEIDPSAIRFNEQNQIELPNSGLIGDNYDDGGAGIQAPPGSYAIINSNNQQQYVEADDSAVYIGTNWPNNNHNWTFSKDGKLTLPAGTSFEYFNTPLTGHGDGLARLDFSLQTDGVVTQWLAASPNPAGSGYSIGNTFTFNDDFLGIPGASVTIEVVSIGPGGSIVELGFTQPPLYPADIYRDSPINIQVGAGSNRWTFKSDGDLKLPGGITAINSIDISAGDAVNIITNNTGSVKTWSFDEDGKLTLPGAIVSTDHLNLDADYDNGYSVYIGNDHPTAGMLGGVVIGDSRGGFVNFQTTKLIIGQTSVPTHSYGAPGDIAGQVAFDNDYIYYCKQNYVNNSTDIWVRVVWTDTNW